MGRNLIRGELKSFPPLLQVLNLIGNQLNGTLPASYKYPASLHTLNIAHNQFSGPLIVPGTIKTLFVFNNQLSSPFIWPVASSESWSVTCVFQHFLALKIIIFKIFQYYLFKCDQRRKLFSKRHLFDVRQSNCRGIWLSRSRTGQSWLFGVTDIIKQRQTHNLNNADSNNFYW